VRAGFGCGAARLPSDRCSPVRTGAQVPSFADLRRRCAGSYRDELPQARVAGHHRRKHRDRARPGRRLTAQVRAQLAEVNASRARLVEAADEQRRRIERDLHDGAQQQLLGLGMSLQAARATVPDGSPTARHLDDATAQLHDSLAELRTLSRGLRPALLAERGLEVALREVQRRARTPVDLTVALAGRPDPVIETAVYFVIVEALQNTTRHATHANVSVDVRQSGDMVDITICDDGPGGADHRAGSGLRGLTDRVAAAGGTLAVTSPPGRGTILAARLPMGAR
jgi:signal transduction histidine kinase